MKTDKSLSHNEKAPNLLKSMNLKKQLKFFLGLREISASQLAKRAGVPKQSLSGWLGGSNPRDVKQIKRVADALGTTVDNLLFGDGPNVDQQRITELDALLGEGWISGLFEVRFRRVKK
jgi:transcriptional regulator with XRE-family HTH domain